MDIHDFCRHYENVSICANISKEDGWHVAQMDGVWTGSQGGVNGVRSENLPQYFITVNKPGKIYLTCIMKERRERCFGDDALFISVSDRNGQLMRGYDHHDKGLAFSFSNMAYFNESINLG